jgi:hypothetical protein
MSCNAISLSERARDLQRTITYARVLREKEEEERHAQIKSFAWCRTAGCDVRQSGIRG